MIGGKRRAPLQFASHPWFAIETGDSATTLELRSEVYFGTLAWSGNWIIRVSTDINATTAIAGGISDHDFAWRLGAGEAFSTPDFVAGFTSNGFDGVRQRLHRYTREIVLPQPHTCEPRPVLYNSWEATSFNVDEAGQFALAERAACWISVY